MVQKYKQFRFNGILDCVCVFLIPLPIQQATLSAIFCALNYLDSAESLLYVLMYQVMQAFR